MPETETAATPASRISRQATGTSTVTVACNLPQGFIMQMYDVEEVSTILPNGREIKENQCTLNLEHGQWHIRGVVNRNSLAAIGAGDVLPDDYRVVRGKNAVPDGGYALTYGVPRDFAEEWFKRNEHSPLVKGKHLFIASSENRAVGQAREWSSQFRSGFEGLNPAGDDRVPNGANQIRKFDRQDNRETSDTAGEAEA